jgi:hypothetical protein
VCNKVLILANALLPLLLLANRSFFLQTEEKRNCSVEKDPEVRSYVTTAIIPSRCFKAVPATARFVGQRGNAPGASACATSETLCPSYGK